MRGCSLTFVGCYHSRRGCIVEIGGASSFIFGILTTPESRDGQAET
jgi:hypothetical protein